MIVPARKLAASLALVAACLVVSIWQARAVPPMPHTLYGQLWLDGAPAADSTQILAVIDGATFASTQTFTQEGSSGLYAFNVPGDDPDTPEKEGGLPGETISFAIDSYEIGQTAAWTQGAVQALDLDNAPFSYASVTQDIGGSGDATFLARDGGPSLIVNAEGQDLGSIRVDITANQDCTAVIGSTIRRCFDIAPTYDTGQDATITFFYYSSQIPAGHTCGAVEAYRLDTSGWVLLTRDPTYGAQGRDCSGTRYSIRVQNVADFSAFVLSAQGPPPTAVAVASFIVEPQGHTLVATWETATEVEVLGFHLYRADAPDGPRLRLNEALISAQAPGSPIGGSYTFVDEGVSPDTSYWYWLEVVDPHNVAASYGPVSAVVQPSGELRIFLPLLHK